MTRERLFNVLVLGGAALLSGVACSPTAGPDTRTADAAITTDAATGDVAADAARTADARAPETGVCAWPCGC